MVTKAGKEAAERWITVGKAPKELGVSQPTFYRWLHHYHFKVNYSKTDKRLRYVDLNEIKRTMGI